MEISKFWEDSGSRASMLIVRQLSVSDEVVCCWMIDIASYESASLVILVYRDAECEANVLGEAASPCCNV